MILTTTIDDIFADALVLTLHERYAAAFAVDTGDFEQVHRLMGADWDEHEEADTDLFDVAGLEASMAYAEACM